jgi:hypothetical protein
MWPSLLLSRATKSPELMAGIFLRSAGGEESGSILKKNRGAWQKSTQLAQSHTPLPICSFYAMSKRERPADSASAFSRDVKRPRTQQQTAEESIEEIISSRHLQGLLVFEQNIDQAVKGGFLVSLNTLATLTFHSNTHLQGLPRQHSLSRRRS